jgi:uncharacterized membrane protein YkoI
MNHSSLNRALSFVLAASFGLCFPSVTQVCAAADAGAIPLAQTPPAVQKAIQASIGNGKVTSITKGDEDGIPSYEVNFTNNGQPRDLHVGEDGRLLSIQMALGETPPAVQKSIQTQLGSDKLDAIEKTFDLDETSYVVELTTKDGRESQFSIGENGALLEMEIALGEAPAPVQKTLAAQMGNGTLTTLTRIIDDRVTYDAEFTKDGKNGNVTIATDGALLSVEITLAETGAAQKTILEKVGNGRIISISKSFEKREKVLPFKVESVKDGKYFNFSVGPKGRFLGMND